VTNGPERANQGPREFVLSPMQLIDPGDSPSPSSTPEHDPYAAIRLGNFRRYWIGNLIATLGLQMQAAALIWEVYDRTGSKLALGWVGLVQVIPVLSLALLAGHVADRTDRKTILMAALALSGLASLGLALVSFFQIPVIAIFTCLFLTGVARAFQQPAKSSFLPQIVPREHFSNAVTWSLGGFQLASVMGPALGGWVLALSGYAYVVYLLEALAATVFIVLLVGVRRSEAPVPHESPTLKSLVEGIDFVWRKKVILGAMALDMFAVLLGGATALLPVFAKDILEIGEVKYGCLLSAPAVGALVMSVALVYRRPMAKAGQTLLWAVAGFGVAIIVFGFSTSFWISLAALFLTGAFDCISVVVRHTLVQLLTPDRMRGRVSAISGMFISASNELGGFESGLVAHLTTPVISVVSGGVGTLIVVAAAAMSVPQLRKYGRLDGQDEPAAEVVVETVS
jgi:MFS family permease